MTAVSSILLDLIIKLQRLPFLKDYSLAGGTSLALRFNHRISDDIDLFTNKIIGLKGFQAVGAELASAFGGNLTHFDIINADSGDQFCFLQSLITNKQIVKVEMIQNMQVMFEPEIHDGVKVLSFQDIGIFKLLSLCSRKANKDVYDLDLITDLIPLSKLFELLENKQNRFSGDTFKSLFDLDENVSPLKDITTLLEFDRVDYSALPSRPSHSNDRLRLLPSSKPWKIARSSWIRKVKELMREKGIEPPPVKPIN